MIKPSFLSLPKTPFFPLHSSSESSSLSSSSLLGRPRLLDGLRLRSLPSPPTGERGFAPSLHTGLLPSTHDGGRAFLSGWLPSTQSGFEPSAHGEGLLLHPRPFPPRPLGA